MSLPEASHAQLESGEGPLHSANNEIAHLSCMYLAHHELESILIMIIITIIVFTTQ